MRIKAKGGGSLTSEVTFLGAGSTVCQETYWGCDDLPPALRNCEMALYDIDPVRLKESEIILSAINKKR